MKALLLAVLTAGAVLTPAAFAQGDVETPQARENYRIGMRQELNRLNDRLSTLELRARVETSRGRENLSTRAGELRAQKKLADDLFTRIETGSEQEKAETRAKLNEAVRDLRTGIEKAEGAHPGWGS